MQDPKPASNVQIPVGNIVPEEKTSFLWGNIAVLLFVVVTLTTFGLMMTNPLN